MRDCENDVMMKNTEMVRVKNDGTDEIIQLRNKLLETSSKEQEACDQVPHYAGICTYQQRAPPGLVNLVLGCFRPVWSCTLDRCMFYFTLLPDHSSYSECRAGKLHIQMLMSLV